MTNTAEERPAHSPLGASGAERWMNCPGSVALLALLTMPESDEPDYRTLGTAAHELAAKCLSFTQDAWEFIGEKFNGETVDTDMANAVQVYLDTVRPKFDLRAEDRQVFIEYPVSSPIHKDFYGTVDAAVIIPGIDYHKQENLDLTDYKHGEGIFVEVEHNAQIMYYAYGFLCEYPEIDKVTLRIVQPRCNQGQPVVREWETTAAYIRHWAENTLVPAMLRTEMDNALDAGPWCRFCPAKLVCPMLSSLFKAACTANPKEVINVSDVALGRSYQYVQAVKFYLKAMEDEAFRRLNMSVEVPGVKLVHKKANRMWGPKAETVLRKKFGDKDTMNPAEFKSPAEIEKLGTEAKALVKEYAYTPQSGLTVALEDDKRQAVKVQLAGESFAAGIAALAAPGNEDGLDLPEYLRREPLTQKTIAGIED